MWLPSPFVQWRRFVLALSDFLCVALLSPGESFAACILMCVLILFAVLFSFAFTSVTFLLWWPLPVGRWPFGCLAIWLWCCWCLLPLLHLWHFSWVHFKCRQAQLPQPVARLLAHPQQEKQQFLLLFTFAKLASGIMLSTLLFVSSWSW